MPSTTPQNETQQQLDKRLADERLEERKRLGLADDAPEELVLAARGEAAEKDDPDGSKKEATVLAWLLGPTEPLEYDCVAHVDTPEGRQDLTFHFRQLDGTRLDTLEKENTEQGILGMKIDRPALNAAMVGEATLYLEDADGNQVDPKSEQFRGPIPLVSDAMRGRWQYQPGILTAVAEEIRVAAGLSNDRVEEAHRAKGKKAQSAEQSIAEAVGGS